MKNLRVSLIQGQTRWHDPAGNRDYYADLIEPLHNTTDLVILPDIEIMQRWWRHMADIMQTHPDNVPVQVPLKRVFYLP